MSIRSRFILLSLCVTLFTIVVIFSLIWIYGDLTAPLVRGIIGVAFFASLITIAAAIMMANMVIQPLKHIVSDIQSISAGDLKQPITINRQDEFGQLALHLDRMRQNLLQSRKQLEKLNADLESRILEQTMELELRTVELQTTSLLLTEEMDRGRMVQVSLLPPAFPEIEGWDIYGASIAAEEIGGDYFDFIPRNDRELNAVIADVSGKGLPAALLMAMVKSGIYAQIPQQSPPEIVLQTINRILCTAWTEKTFVTLFYAMLNTATGVMHYASAGHPFPYTVRGVNGSVQIDQLAATSLPMGVQSDLTFHCHEHQFQAGETLILYNSGIVNAMNAKTDLFGFERFERLLKKHYHLPASEIINEVFETLSQFCGTTPQKDDMTISIIRKL
ncbi:MAG: HAMP domain-containing protein [Gemmatimonadetes bacterium]|nr:MAG: HAMP domain-containing protein [Gemmatimonadota bacterium]